MSDSEQQQPAEEMNAASQEGVQTDPTPSAEEIAAVVKGHARVQAASATLAFLSNQANSMLQMMCGGNTRMCLSVASELKLFYEEAVRRSVEFKGPEQPQAEAPKQDNEQQTEETEQEIV